MNNHWLNELDEFGQSPLTRASSSGCTELCELMLLQETHDRPQVACMLPPIHKAASLNFDDVILDLVEDGHDVDEADDQGQTALHKAARMGNAEAAKVLLDHGALVNREDLFGMTPLHWAAITGSLRVAQVLLEHRADIVAPDKYAGGVTPVRIATFMGYTEMADLFEHYLTRY